MAKAAVKKKRTAKKTTSRRGTERVFSDGEKAAITNCARMGMPQTRIAEIFDCSFNTLKKHCGRELEFGVELANAAVAGALYDNAVTLNNVSAQIFWLKTKGGWREEDQNADRPPGTLNINLFPTASAE